MSASPAHSFALLCIVFTAALLQHSHGVRIVSAPADQKPLAMTYHWGALLFGNISVNLIFYGKFTPSQRAIISDFVASLSAKASASPEPSAAVWWRTLAKYYAASKRPPAMLTLGEQISDASYSLGKSLRDGDLAVLAAKAPARGAVSVVLTAADVAVERFCLSRCGSHASDRRSRSVYVWVGNPEAQCPGQCAWPFHRPPYGPQTPPLVAPNGDVGADGMVINLASMLAGAITNPFGDGFFQGTREAPLEAATACPGVYAKGAYPGYPGDLLVDAATGGSYNADGARGRKYVVPAIFDPSTSMCSTLV